MSVCLCACADVQICVCQCACSAATLRVMMLENFSFSVGALHANMRVVNTGLEIKKKKEKRGIKRELRKYQIKRIKQDMVNKGK